MNNTIDIWVEFSYQGESHRPTATVDLDLLMTQGSELPDLHLLLAKQCGIDTYSYLYEVMESHEVQYANATGIASACLHEGHFDAVSFAQRWREQRELNDLQAIAKQHLQIDDLQRHESIKQALLAAYRLGKAQAGQA